MADLLPIQKGELKANDAVVFFDNILDENGTKLIKSKKRAYLKYMMTSLYQDPAKNRVTLSDGRIVPIIVARKNPGRGVFCYFNNKEAPQSEIFKAFADIYNITYKEQLPELKQKGELIAQETLNYLDNVCLGGKKLVGSEKLIQVHKLFAKLYGQPQQNKCLTDAGEVPIIVRHKGTNNKIAYFLNAETYRKEVFRAFAQWAGCTYCEDKEGLTEPPAKAPNEWTARVCARIFHNVPDLNKKNPKRDASPKLVDWFAYIGNNTNLNRVKLPDGTEIPLLVYRQSCSQKCWCLNVSDEYAKPYVIKRVAEIIKAEICLKNIRLQTKETKRLYKAIKALKQENSASIKEIGYYNAYAQKIYETLRISKEITVSDYLKNKKIKE